MEFWAACAGVILLLILFSEKKPPKRYRRSDLVIGREANGARGEYCVYCCSENFSIVCRGSLSQCEQFISRSAD